MVSTKPAAGQFERYASTLADLHLVAFVCLMLKKAALLAADS